MPTRETCPNGAPIWIDLMTSDVAGARSFYGQLLGWTSEEPNEEFGGYVNFGHDGVRTAGAMAKEAGNPMPDCWSVYLATADIDATTKAVEANGGQTIVPPMPVGDLGSMAVYIDPSGAAIGAWQPGTHTGFTTLAEPGAPSWFELHTRDFDAAVPFYTEAFAWPTNTMSDDPSFRYATYGEGDDQAAGIYDAKDMAEGIPSHWQVYFDVEDVDASVAKATELGATVIEAPVDTPYGRISHLLDPTGATFKLRRSPA